MQDIAREFGFSETAFVHPGAQPGVYHIRYFSPKQEIPLCGHATLSAAKVIFRDHHETTLHFITGGHLDLLVRRKGEEIIMEFPVYQTTAATAPAEMLSALGIDAVTNARYNAENNIIMLEIGDTAKLAALQPDFQALVQSYSGIAGVLVTAPAKDGNYDYHYRYFWPWAGTDEDPVTGAVQTFMANYWAEKLQQNSLRAFQSSSRTGAMQLEVKDDKVLLIAQAVIILEGSLLI